MSVLGRVLRWSSYVAGFLVQKVRNLVLRFLIATSPRTRLEGFVVSDCMEIGTTEELYRKLGEALELIKHADTRRFARIRRDVRRIVFLQTGPEYWPSLRACVLQDVSALAPERVALHIVHEATHARLWNSGFRYDRSVQSRVERICVTEELQFLRRLPDSSVLVREIEQKLADEWWSLDRRLERAGSDLRSAHAPRWMLAWQERLLSRAKKKRT